MEIIADSDGKWFSINEYSRCKLVSISTIRRYIRANKVKSKKIDGKYFIFLPSSEYLPEFNESKKVFELELEKERLIKKIRNIENENSELKMLVDLYESQQEEVVQKTSSLPAIPL